MGNECPACHKSKPSGLAFCPTCYRSLPAPLAKPLWKRFGGGFEEGFERALEYLQGETGQTKAAGGAA